MTGAATPTHWLAKDASCDAICLGTGRFLRSVLVPVLVSCGYRPALVQPRGTSFVEYMSQRDAYDIDTVQPDGTIENSSVPCYGAFSMVQRNALRQCMLDADAGGMKRIRFVGIGVTEAGLASAQTQAMKDLYWMLDVARQQWDALSAEKSDKLVVLDMDNVPGNGQVLQRHMLELAEESQSEEMRTFLAESVSFVTTMVDRITSHRDGDTMVPRCEPLPAKALVILDDQAVLPPAWKEQSDLGVIIRSLPEQLDSDVSLKLRVANGTHTAVANILALLKHPRTEILSSASGDGAVLMGYLDQLVALDIVPAAADVGDAQAVYDDWRRRLTHAHFGLSSFFITQNGPAKGGVRLSPTVMGIIKTSTDNNESKMPSPNMMFAFAALLRWLTSSLPSKSSNGIYTGWFLGSPRPESEVSKDESGSDTVTYADGLRYNFRQGWYEFRCACEIDGKNLSDQLSNASTDESAADIIRSYLLAPDGGDLKSIEGSSQFEQIVSQITTFYRRLVSCDSNESALDLIKSLNGP